MSALRRASTLFRSALYRPHLASCTRLSSTASTASPAAVADGGEAGLGTVGDVLLTKGEKFYSIRGDQLVIDAVKKMVKHNIGSLIIVEEPAQRAVGIVTETDYLNKVIVLGRSSKSTLVKDIMSTKEFTYVAPSATLQTCMQLMTERRIRHIPVIEPDTNAVLGMVSVGDIVSELVAAHKRDAEHMRSFIQGSY